jgi:hypothetical protein
MATRGRPPKDKSQNAENKNLVENSQVKSTEEETIVIKKTELENIYKMIEDLQNNIKNNSNIVTKKNSEDDIEENYVYEEEEEVPLNSYIKVMSLIPYELNLSTERHGKGRIFTFRGYGKTKRIIYQELEKIIEENRHFLERGFFIILDKRVVRKHGLDDIYKNIMNKEKMDMILLGFQGGEVKENDILSFAKSAPKEQQKILATMVIDKRINGETIDLNLFDKLGRIMDMDLNQKYEDSVAFLEIAKNKV